MPHPSRRRAASFALLGLLAAPALARPWKPRPARPRPPIHMPAPKLPHPHSYGRTGA